MDSLGLVWKGGSMDNNKKEYVQPVSLVKQEFSELSSVKKDFDEKQLAFVKTTIAPTLNDNELLLFLYKAQKLGLNPLNGEIFAYASFETIGGEKVRKMITISARDGKRKIASQTRHLKSIKTTPIYTKQVDSPIYSTVKETKPDGIIIERMEIVEGKTEKITKTVTPWEGGTLYGAVCTITRDDYDEQFSVTVPFAEYKRETYIWKSKPETMIKKVAQSQCLSEAFPELLAGVYDESERWDDTPIERVVVVENGNEPADENVIETIKNMGGVLPENGKLTRQQASDMIRELGTKKARKV